MNILHVLDHSVPLQSGYAMRTLAIVQHQRALGWHTAHLTSAKHAGATAAEEEVDGLWFHRTPSPRGRLGRLPLLQHLAVVHGLRRRLDQLIPTLEPDILHAHSPSLTGVAALRAGRRWGLPVVYEVRALWEDGAVEHGWSTEGDWRYRATRALETYVLRHADAVTTICEGLRRNIVERGIPAERVTVIPNGVDPQRFATRGSRDAELARRLGLEARRVVGYIGSFYAYEGLALLLEAFSDILSKAPDARLLLVGGGFQEEALRQRASALGLAGAVVFTGYVPHQDVPAYSSLVDVFVYPRRRVRVTDLVTPLKPLEAMADGRVVVASDVGGHREIVRDGETGLLFPADDADALAATVLSVLDDPDRAVALGAAARRFVETERTWARSVARYSTVYLELTRRRSFRPIRG